MNEDVLDETDSRNDIHPQESHGEVIPSKQEITKWCLIWLPDPIHLPAK